MNTRSRFKPAIIAFAFAAFLTGCGGGGGGSSGTPSGGSNGGSGYNGFAPNSVAGRKILGTRTFTSTGPVGQTHVYTFSSTKFHDSDPPEESDGNYTYAAGNSSAVLDLHYTSPSGFVGDNHHIEMNFTEQDKGNFQSVYTRGDGTAITINGTFVIQ
jgi:hypothetical protein